MKRSTLQSIRNWVGGATAKEATSERTGQSATDIERLPAPGIERSCGKSMQNRVGSAGTAASGAVLFGQRWTCLRRIIGASLCVAALTWTGSGAQGVIIDGPTVGVSGGLTVLDPGNNPRVIAGVFTWETPVALTGSGWRPLENLTIRLVGPLNTPGAAPTEREVNNVLYPVDRFPTDLQGNLSGHFGVPDLLPPGRYKIYAVRDNPVRVTDRADSSPFTVCPDTIVIPHFEKGVLAHNWAYERGGRDGWLKRIGENQSPERVDPEWVSVWSKEPVGIYATVAKTNLDGANQPSHVAYHDYPSSHYGHDIDLHLVPDEEYRWVLATANYQGREGERETGRIEWEWETQNNGTPFFGSYGHGNIGFPLFATPTAGDRVYTVGWWVLDNGHPDTGDHSEIHPARMIATMRKRNTAVPLGDGTCMTRAKQLDIFVSGHGGGISHYYDALEDLLDNNGQGGARLRDFMFTPEIDVYRSFGPKPTSAAVNDLLQLLQIPGIEIAPTVYTHAGPSALSTDSSGRPALSGTPWVLGPEERPINDMDYDFDMPLPPAPAGATRVLVQTTQYPMHTTRVEEEITYTNLDPATGLPTTAHVHLPYKGADNGIYARRLNFYWDVYSPPGEHFVVKIDDVKSSRASRAVDSFRFFLGPQPLYLWADVSGQWVFLTGINPDGFLTPVLSSTGGVDTVGRLDAATFDVYLDPDDTLRVFTHGYAQRKMDELFNREIGRNNYDVGIDVAMAAKLDTGDNQDLGGALFDSPWISTNVVGSHSVPADPGSSGPVNTLNGTIGPVPNPVFTVDFTVTHVPAPRHIEVTGAPADFGKVSLGTIGSRQIQIVNSGDEPLDVSGIAVSGAGYSILPDPEAPYTLLGFGDSAKLLVLFSPTDISQGVGALTINSNDTCQPSLTLRLCGEAVPQAGIRVLVLQGNGTPYPVVDQITLTSDGVPQSNVNLKDVPFTVVSPPASCQTRQYHYQAELSPNGTSGQAGSYYQLRVRIGNKLQSLRFSLGAGEFKEIVVTVQ